MVKNKEFTSNCQLFKILSGCGSRYCPYQVIGDHFFIITTQVQFSTSIQNSYNRDCPLTIIYSSFMPNDSNLSISASLASLKKEEWPRSTYLGWVIVPNLSVKISLCFFGNDITLLLVHEVLSSFTFSNFILIGLLMDTVFLINRKSWIFIVTTIQI